jgi:hypothetical protein
MGKIYFILDTRAPQTLYAQYDGRSAQIGLELVPKVMDSKTTLLFEEQLELADNYLTNILT